MTGFGRGTGHHEGVLATVEIATVNRKQAEVVIQLPRELTELESPIRKAVLEGISRGRAQVSIKLERENAEATELKVDHDLAVALHQALRQLGEEIGEDLSGVPVTLTWSPHPRPLPMAVASRWGSKMQSSPN